MKPLATLVFALLCVSSTWTQALPPTVILIELAGGNDGLNTVVPFQDPLYPVMRPSVQWSVDKLLSLGSRSPGLAFAPDLSALTPSWSDGDMAVVLGVGYSGQNRSHFRSIDIWDTATEPQIVRSDGWLTRVAPWEGTLADEVVVGEVRAGPFRGSAQVLSLKDVPSFLKAAQTTKLETDELPGQDQTLWAQSRRLIDQSATYLKKETKVMGGGPQYPDTGLGRQFATVSSLIHLRFPTRVYKSTLRGFDTHKGQLEDHAQLLAELAGAVAALRADLKASGDWDNVLVVTYSEFGRRVRENGSGGTDHGSASVSMLWGGRVLGGIVGTYPSLSNLADGDLIASIDFRRLWATVLTFLSPTRPSERNSEVFGRDFSPLPVLKNPP